MCMLVVVLRDPITYVYFGVNNKNFFQSKQSTGSSQRLHWRCVVIVHRVVKDVASAESRKAEFIFFKFLLKYKC